MSRSASTRHLLKSLSPIITMTATWVVRRGMISVYERRTGQPAPLVYQQNASPIRRVLWTVAVAGTVAIIEVVILELLAEDDE